MSNHTLTPGAAITVTAANFEAVHYGIPVCHIGEDGDMLALGHHEPRRALAAFNRHDRVYCGLNGLFDDPGMSASEALKLIRVLWATFRTPDPERGDDPDCDWYVRWADTPIEGATPITVITVWPAHHEAA